jgi:hypothetical protein
LLLPYDKLDPGFRFAPSRLQKLKRHAKQKTGGVPMVTAGKLA